ncbi:hypothetical protein B2K_38285 [Paenibacillus mucilaginosus K02]|uniref:Uncharacterized protein n=1 Tax=Paenibacillus mucilaginosus K02 TaxID=997761 RepID=R9UL37_9BACL|nr:hypothetical protein B2K_38285 [Paenibacillus mucilaginosus K02]
MGVFLTKADEFFLDPIYRNGFGGRIVLYWIGRPVS